MNCCFAVANRLGNIFAVLLPLCQLSDLRPLAKARGYEIVAEYSDTITGTKQNDPDSIG